MSDSISRALVRLAVHGLPRAVQTRYEREFSADLSYLDSTPRRLAYAARVLTHTPGLRRALVVEGTATMSHHKPLRCALHLHHMVWFSTSDGGRWKHCSRCGTDWSGGRPMGWTYDMARRGEMGF